MEMDALKLCWQREVRTETHRPLEASTVSGWVQARAADIRRDVRRRLRREIGYYVPTLVFLVLVGLIGNGGVTGVTFAAGLIAVLGGLMLTLWFFERALRRAPLDGNLRDVLTALLAGVEAASHAYLLAYVLVFVCGVTVISATIGWRSGFGARFAASLAVGMIAIAWSFWSGRAYVERMFGRYRTALADCLRELNAT